MMKESEMFRANRILEKNLNLRKDNFAIIIPKEDLIAAKMIVEKLSNGVIKVEDERSRFNCYRILETPEKYTLCFKR